MAHPRMLLTLIALAGLVSCPPALADTPMPPRPFKELSPDEEYVFVMLVPERHGSAAWFDRRRAEEYRHIQDTYPQSGLYRNDGSTEPLWTVDWYAHNVHVASDGVHLVRLGPWASSFDQEAVSFFAEGELLRTYKIDELVDQPWSMPRTASYFQWRKDEYFNDAELAYTIHTLDGNRFVFDVSSGEVVSRVRPARIFLGLLGLAALFPATWTVMRWWRRRRERMGADDSPTGFDRT